MYSSCHIVVGGVYSFNVNGDEENPTNLNVGAFTRFSNLNDAVIPHVGLEFGAFRMGGMGVALGSQVAMRLADLVASR